MPTYALLAKTRHPEYDLEYWRKIRALHAGGKRFREALRDPALLDALIPRHLGEEDAVYVERIKRAFCIPYLGQLVDYMVQLVGSDPVTMTAGGEDEDMAPGSVDGYYEELCQNTARPHGEKCSLNQLLRQCLQTALLCRRAWVLADFPRTPEVAPRNRAEQEMLGLDRAYLVPLDPEQVLDWDPDDEDCQLAWVNVCRVSRRRASVEAKRNIVREEFTIYDRQGWARYVYEYDPDKPAGKGGPPQDDQLPDSEEHGTHSFGRVPIQPLELPESLWAGAKLESLATQHLNARCALSWGQIQSLFQILVAKLQGPGEGLDPLVEDTERALNQPIGPGRIVTLAEKDSLGWASPDAAPFKEAREDIKELKDEMFRIFQQMSQAVDNGASSKKQSGESKAVDMSSSVTLAKDLGRRILEFAVDLMRIVADGRQDAGREWSAAGAEQFAETSLESYVSEAATLETIIIPSPTFQRLYKYGLASKLLPGATEDQLETIFGELEANLTSEALMGAAPYPEPQDPEGDPGDSEPKAVNPRRSAFSARSARRRNP